MADRVEAVEDSARADLAEDRTPTARPAGRRRAAGRLGRLRRALVVVGTLVALEVLMFSGYFDGSVSPPWDFFGSYNTEAFVWWEEGGFFQPVSWIPHAWGGYPSAVSIQNSAWYLPVGLVAAVTTYDIHASAALSALHVAFGALGALVLAHVWRLGFRAGMLGLVAFFFAASFYANAEHVDIARGYAWMPWILALLSPGWPWRRWWAVPVAALILWQALLTTYPGMIAAGVYVYLAWLVAVQVWARPRLRDHLVPLAVSGAIALLLLGPKYLPTALLSGSGGDVPDESVLSWGMLGTFVYPYGNPALPNDISMRSFFLPVTCLLLAGFAAWRHPLARAAGVAGLVAVVLGVPNLPWHGALASLPGLGVSRFQLSDFRASMLLVLLVLAMAGFSRLVGDAPDTPAASRPSRVAGLLGGRTVPAWAWPAAVCVGAAGLGVAGPYRVDEWVPAFAVLAGAALVVAQLAQGLRTPEPGTPRAGSPVARLDRRTGATALVALTLVSGVTWAWTTTVTWRTPRADTEAASYGATVDALLAERQPWSGTQRPGRTPLPQPLDASGVVSTLWNAGYWNGTDAVGGYVNLKRSPTWTTIVELLMDPELGPPVNAFYSAPGLVLSDAGETVPDEAALERCRTSQDCGDGLTSTPAGYEPGQLVYEVTAEQSTAVVLNEAFYPGWTARVCPVPSGSGECQDLEVTEGAAGAVATTVPAGAWELTVDYTPPGYRLGWAAFWAGAVLAGLVALGSWLVGRRPAPRPRPTPTTAGPQRAKEV